MWCRYLGMGVWEWVRLGWDPGKKYKGGLAVDCLAGCWLFLPDGVTEGSQFLAQLVIFSVGVGYKA